jgi:hypothetical protein
VAGTSNYPGALDNFAEASPTNLGDEDSTGRTHSERHDDVEAAMEAVQGELGTNPAGSASTVSARLDDVDTTVSNLISASAVTASLSAIQSDVDSKIAASAFIAAGDLLVGAGSASVGTLAIGSNSTVLTVDTNEPFKVKWAPPATIEDTTISPLLLMGA